MTGDVEKKVPRMFLLLHFREVNKKGNGCFISTEDLHTMYY